MPRTAIILKTKDENIKPNVKKQYAEEKTFSRGTGGGPVQKLSTETSIASTVGEILQSKMTGETSIYDSDNCNQIENENIGYISENDDVNMITITNLPEILSDDYIDKYSTNEPEEVKHDKPLTTTKRNWKNYTPADLKSRSTLTSTVASDGHVPKKAKAYQDKIASWASTRAELSEQQQSNFIEQHKLKMDLMQKKHDLEIKIMVEKHHIEMKNFKLTNEILQLQKERENKLMP